MPFSYSDAIDTDVGFADNTNASTGWTYHSRSFNAGSTDVKKLTTQGRTHREHGETSLFKENMALWSIPIGSLTHTELYSPNMVINRI